MSPRRTCRCLKSPPICAERSCRARRTDKGQSLQARLTTLQATTNSILRFGAGRATRANCVMNRYCYTVVDARYQSRIFTISAVCRAPWPNGRVKRRRLGKLAFPSRGQSLRHSADHPEQLNASLQRATPSASRADAARAARSPIHREISRSDCIAARPVRS